MLVRAVMLFLSLEVSAELAGWARAGYPHEACGVLVGSVEGDSRRVLHATHARNLAEVRERYELDPAALVTAESSARARGLTVVGIWHSHPDAPARPSEVDQGAAWSGWSYLILSVGENGVMEVRAWRLVGGRFEEEEVSER